MKKFWALFFPPKPYLGHHNLLPEQDSRELALSYVMMVLVFLACSAGLILVASNRAQEGWSEEISSEVTIQVLPSGLESGSVAAAKAAEILSGVRGVEEARALEPEKAKALLKPWLGEAVLDDLPIPNLVQVKLDQKNPATRDDLENAMSARAIKAEIDDHSLWLKDIEQSAGLIRLFSFCVFFVIATAAAAVVRFATRAGLAARASVVEILSLCGAQDVYVAQRFQIRFARLAFVAGSVGLVMAGALAMLAKTFGPSEGLAIALPFLVSDLLFILPVPFFVAIIAGLTARWVTLRLLGEGI